MTKYRVMFDWDIEANSEADAEQKALEELATCDSSDNDGKEGHEHA